jgi:ribose 5-phosphate isomerase B
MMMKISIACDHAAFDLKNHIKQFVADLGHEVEDFGIHENKSVDYPDVVRPAAQAVANGTADMAILICGTGIGVSMVANKVKGVRAALCSETLSAARTRQHNDANCLCIGARLTGPEMAEEITRTFLASEFEGGRHQIRVDKIETP